MIMDAQFDGKPHGGSHQQNEHDTGPLDPSKMTREQRAMLEKINALEIRLDALQTEVSSFIRLNPPRHN